MLLMGLRIYFRIFLDFLDYEHLIVFYNKNLINKFKYFKKAKPYFKNQLLKEFIVANFSVD